MNAQQAENLRILIRHMERGIGRDRLNMQRVFFEPPDQDRQICGTPACAIGEAYMMSELRQEFDCIPSAWNFDRIAAYMFGVTWRLFSSGEPQDGSPPNAWGRDRVTPQEWAAEARKVLAENGYTMLARDDGYAAFMEKVREPVMNEAEVKGAKIQGVLMTPAHK